MNEWDTRKLGETLTIKYGKDHKKLGVGSFPCIGSGGVMRYVDGTLCEETSILIPRKGSLNNIMFQESPFWTVDTMFWSIINEELANSKFLFYQLTLIDFSNLNVGSAVPSLTVPIINEIKVSLPPLQEQKQIAHILSTLDAKIDLLRRQNETLENMAQALFKRWFVDFEFPDDNGNPYKSSGGKMIPSELGEIPEGWSVGNLGYLGSIEKISVKPQLKKETDFFHFSIPAFDNGKKPELEKGAEILSNKYQVNEGRILVSKLNPITSRVWSNVLCWGENQVCSTEFQPIFPNARDDYSFILCQLRNKIYANELAKMAGGTSSSHQRVKPEDILGIEVPIPPSEVRKEFHSLINPQTFKNERLLREIQTLTKTRDTLLPKLMSGQVRVKNLEVA